MEKTLIVVKPHAVARGLTGEFLARLERKGFRIEAVRGFHGDRELWERFYPSSDEWMRSAGGKTLGDYEARGQDPVPHLGTSDPLELGRMIKSWLVDHMASGLSVAAVLVGNEVQSQVRALCGATLPNKAQPGTIRFDYSDDSPLLANEEKRPLFNLIHASDPEEDRDGVPAAEFEIATIFD